MAASTGLTSEGVMRMLFGDDWCDPNYERDKLYYEVNRALNLGSNGYKIKPDDFIYILRTLHKLARQFVDDKTLKELRKANSWLAVFEPASTSGWAEAKSKFIQDGPAVLDALASFTDLICMELQIGLLLVKDTHPSVRLLQIIFHRLNDPSQKENLMNRQYGDSGTVDKLVTNKLKDVPKVEPTRTRVAALLRNVFEADDGSASEERAQG
jgi:hypothetical protein